MSLEHRFAREDAAIRRRSRPTTKADETTEFVAFWTIWKPRMNANDGRGSARDEFFRHVEEYGADAQDIVDGARWFIRNGGNNGVGSDGRPIRLHAQTWLNRRAYEDFAESERAHQQRQEQQQSADVTVLRPPKPQFLQDYERKKAGGE